MTSPLPPLGIYVHWPYCARICPYCDFNVYKTRQVERNLWSAAFTAELHHWHAQTKGRRLKSLYFGGGTPSLAPLPVLEAVIEQCNALWGFAPNAEITLEANPDDITPHSVTHWKQAGINRLSLGVQSFDDDGLKILGRNHSGDDAKRALTLIKEQFDLFTFDLIYARHEQTWAQWQRDLSQALSFESPHLSLYQLTIEPGTAYAQQVQRGSVRPAGDDLAADMYDDAVTTLASAGLVHYEISNFAKPAHEAVHNMLYWQHQDYIGVGPGAHGRVTRVDEKGRIMRVATETFAQPQTYLDQCQQYATGVEQETPLTHEDQMLERFSMGLRLHRGIPLLEDDVFFQNDGRRHHLNKLIEDGFMIYENQTLRASADGRRVLNTLLLTLFG